MNKSALLFATASLLFGSWFSSAHASQDWSYVKVGSLCVIGEHLRDTIAKLNAKLAEDVVVIEVEEQDGKTTHRKIASPFKTSALTVVRGFGEDGVCVTISKE